MAHLLMGQVPSRWDAKQAILELREADYQWRQMEWIGWYFEYKAREIIMEGLGGTKGPRYGSTEFDYRGKHVWDFKAHIENATSHPWTIINDKEAVDLCMSSLGGMGVILAYGLAEYNDEKGTFKAWHDQLKGGRSDYEAERIRSGAPSRKRKTAFLLKKIEALWLDSERISKGIREDWIRFFQEGMRNANGSPRRTKYMLNLDALPTYMRIL